MSHNLFSSAFRPTHLFYELAKRGEDEQDVLSDGFNCLPFCCRCRLFDMIAHMLWRNSVKTSTTSSTRIVLMRTRESLRKEMSRGKHQQESIRISPHIIRPCNCVISLTRSLSGSKCKPEWRFDWVCCLEASVVQTVHFIKLIRLHSLTSLTQRRKLARLSMWETTTASMTDAHA